MSRNCRRFSFTIGKEFTNDVLFDELPPRFAFIIWQLERAPSTGYLHYQGYVRCKNACSFGQVKRLIGNEAHVEASKGSEAQNIKYCTKEESRIDGPWELGERATQGARTDLEDLITLVKDNKTDAELFENNEVAFSKFKRYIDNARGAFFQPKRHDNIKVFVLVGPTGTGKSHWAWDKFPNLYEPIVTEQGKVWWDGYSQNDTILLDDYRGAIPYNKLLTLLDKYPKRGEIKGSSIALNFSTVIITSNNHISDWYPLLSHTDLDPLRRRILTGGLYEIRSRDDLNQILIENQ